MEWVLYSRYLTVCIVCTRQGGNRPCLGRTLGHPLASSQVLLQKVLLSSVSGLWEVPLRTRVPQMLYLGGAKVVLTKESTAHLCAPRPQVRNNWGSDGEVSPPICPVQISLSWWRCCCLVDASRFWAPLSSQFRTLIPNSHCSLEADGPIFLLIRSPKLCPVPSPNIALQLCFITWGWQLFRGDSPPGSATELWPQVSHCIIPKPFMLKLPEWDLEGERGGGLLESPQGWEKTLLFPRILHTVPSQHAKQNEIQMCIFKEQF